MSRVVSDLTIPVWTIFLSFAVLLEPENYISYCGGTHWTKHANQTGDKLKEGSYSTTTKNAFYPTK